MSGEDALDSRNLTFSQAYGYEELPQPLKLEEISDGARTKLWSVLFHFLESESNKYLGIQRVRGSWRTMLIFLHVEYHERALDEFDDYLENFIRVYKPIFMRDQFNEVFDLLLAIMRHQECPQDFIWEVKTIFKASRLAYVVDTSSPVTIYPAATEEEGEAVLRATADLSNAGLAGAVNHLRQASENISQGDYAGAVRESIHAVESTARRIDPNAQSLEPALKWLEKESGLHPALKRGFSNLYGFASDEEGIRHALIDNPRANVGLDEAVFMLGACASFSSYLARKYRPSAA